ncbi:hypothetical protein RE6C_05517 [Rhodopirellula europaea 6C]|uniref:Uncharacterized protein n=1 Tax=Rhodopirellula europaea 6C TaxID=1263867 RepID=M2AV33_9BACT|nr:hypothetical protein RE6C_05517 [Rhodopirellula europaea 6C]
MQIVSTMQTACQCQNQSTWQFLHQSAHYLVIDDCTRSPAKSTTSFRSEGVSGSFCFRKYRLGMQPPSTGLLAFTTVFPAIFDIAAHPGNRWQTFRPGEICPSRIEILARNLLAR